MQHPNFVLLYVDQPETSADFYAKLLDARPIERSATFALFALSSGLKLGLWSKHTVEPKADNAPGSGEIAFSLESPAAVQALCTQWQADGLQILQAPTQMDFGFTFVALDPDGHRLRVFAPSM